MVEGFELVVAEENKLVKLANKKKLHFLETSDRQGTDARNRNQSPIENLFTSSFFSMATLIDEIKRVVLVKYDFEYREK